MMDNIIGQRLNTALAKAGKQQKELAQMLNVPPNTISYFCSGKRTPNTKQVITIARYLGISADYLLGLSDQPSINTDDKFLTDKVGLTPAAVGKLKAYSLCNRMKSLNILLEQDDFDYILDDILHCAEIGHWKTLFEQSFRTNSKCPDEYEQELIKTDRRREKLATAYDATYRLGKICEQIIAESQEGVEK
jgi:transcriptional regulator with XRE-family HTH domain